MSENVPFKIPSALKGLNEMRALNTTDRSIEGLRDGAANGTIPVAQGHTAESRADPSYEHWCRPEPTREFPWKSSDVERAREKQGGMQENTDLPRNDVGAVKGSQVGVRVPQNSPHFQNTGWGEYSGLDQWDRAESGTYSEEKDEPFDK